MQKLAYFDYRKDGNKQVVAVGKSGRVQGFVLSDRDQAEGLRE